jgi:acrylyl-CoA reductase (NADPH)
MDTFKALRVYAAETIEAKLEDLTLDDLNEGEVVIKVVWSCVNYKDALAVTGAGKILRTSPLVGGIDVSGVVVESSDRRFAAGDEVLVTSDGLSETHDGGYAEYARLRAEQLISVPAGFSMQDVMALGTAGFTAALAVHRMEQNGQSPDMGPIAVSGATGGVGSVAIDLLSGRGYEVHAISSKTDSVAYLKSLGAAAVLHPTGMDMGTRAMERAVWGGAVDNLGGDMLSWFTRSTKYGGNVASIGLAASHKLETTVMPFILRGVNLLGINAVETPRELREEVWARLANDLQPQHLDKIVTGEVSLDELQGCLQDWIDGKVTGRKLVRIG